MEQNLWAAVKLERYYSMLLKQRKQKEKEWKENVLEVLHRPHLPSWMVKMRTSSHLTKWLVFRM